MGDLNAYAMNDPLQMLYKVGYSNQITRFDSDTAYSYSFKAQASCLDHILANRTMASQITGVKSFHINADEPTMFDYNRDYVDNMYRCSDHDPVVCGLNLGVYNDSLLPVIGDKVLLYPNPAQSYVDVMSANNYRLRIVDYNGTVVYNEYIGEDIHRISLTELALPQGVYLFQFKENKTINPKTVVLKLIVN